MDGLAIFGLQFGLTLLVCALLARWYVAPWLRTLGLHDALLVLTIPHALRHVGLVFLVPAVVDPSLPPAFAGPAAYGDLATALLALVALVALRRRWHGSLTWAWLVHGVGALDLLVALGQGTRLGVAPLLGAAWYVPTFLVPALLVGHALGFALLAGGRRRPSPLPA